MKEDRWVELSVRIPAQLVLTVKEFLENLGSVGIVEDSLAEKGEPEVASPLIKGYLCGSLKSAAEKIEIFKKFVASLSDLFPGAVLGEVLATETGEDDWQRWREYFKPVAVSPRIVIKPTWEPYEAKDGEVVVEIDPGMAFGTGTHETTRLCIQLLDNIIRGGESVFDVGTGSGILAIAAAKLGAAEVLGIDNDEKSVSVAAENVELNSAQKNVSVSGIPLSDVEGLFDIVVANILAEDLIEMRKELLKRLATGGRIILSGILKTKAEMVIAAYSDEGATLEEQVDDGDWSALMFKI